MIVRRLKLIRLQNRLSEDSLAKIVSCKRSALHAYENSFCNLDENILKDIAKYFNTTIENITGYCDMEINKNCSKRDFQYELFSEVVTVKEVAAARKEHLRKKNEYDKARKKRAEREKKKQKELLSKSSAKPFKCLNECCLLNKNKMCDNPVVINGVAPCFGKDRVKSKSGKLLSGSDTKLLFIADRLQKIEKGLFDNEI